MHSSRYVSICHISNVKDGHILLPKTLFLIFEICMCRKCQTSSFSVLKYNTEVDKLVKVIDCNLNVLCQGIEMGHLNLCKKVKPVSGTSLYHSQTRKLHWIIKYSCVYQRHLFIKLVSF